MSSFDKHENLIILKTKTISYAKNHKHYTLNLLSYLFTVTANSILSRFSEGKDGIRNKTLPFKL